LNVVVAVEVKVTILVQEAALQEVVQETTDLKVLMLQVIKVAAVAEVGIMVQVMAAQAGQA
jgi:hypothetical protein